MVNLGPNNPLRSQSGYAPSPRTQPLNQTPLPVNPTSLNDRLNTSYIDVRVDDNSWHAALTRGIVEFVGAIVTPKQMLGVLRVLKAITLSFLVLTIAADLMYMSLLEIFASETLRAQVGGNRDTIIRIYGLLLSAIAIGVEFDVSRITKSFSGLKGFIPRGILLFFIATLTRAHPIVNSFAGKGSSSSSRANNDDAYADDANGDDVVATDDYTYHMQQEAAEIPYSSIVFQQVASSVLGLCAFVYFVLGLFCFDRFTSKAFLSTKNPLITTAIPQPNGTHLNVPSAAYQHPAPVGIKPHAQDDGSGEFT